MGHKGDACKGFSSESKGKDRGQVLVVLDLGSCESMAEDGEILLLDAFAIVTNGDQLQASFFDGYTDVG